MFEKLLKMHRWRSTETGLKDWKMWFMLKTIRNSMWRTKMYVQMYRNTNKNKHVRYICCIYEDDTRMVCVRFTTTTKRAYTGYVCCSDEAYALKQHTKYQILWREQKKNENRCSKLTLAYMKRTKRTIHARILFSTYEQKKKTEMKKRTRTNRPNCHTKSIPKKMLLSSIPSVFILLGYFIFIRIHMSKDLAGRCGCRCRCCCCLCIHLRVFYVS